MYTYAYLPVSCVSGLYGPHNVKILKDALENLGREDLRKHIIEFESVKVFDEESA